jgi:dTDP-4-amino-4,6-dideoxygalactose transaminase
MLSSSSLKLPETERVARRVIVLPTGQAVSLEDIAKVCGIIRSALDQSSKPLVIGINAPA